MKRQRHLLAAIALLAAVFAATGLLMAGCKGVEGVSGTDTGAASDTIEFIGTAEITNDKPFELLLTLSDEVEEDFEFRGITGFTLNAGGDESYPVNLSMTDKPNGLYGVTFYPDFPKTAVIALDGWVEATDVELTLSYDKESKELHSGDVLYNSFKIPVKNNVAEDTKGPFPPDPDAPEPKVTSAIVSDAAPKSVMVNFNVPVFVNSVENFTVEVNGVLISEIESYTVSGAGLEIVLKYGMLAGDSAVLSYIKGETNRVVSTDRRELETFIMPIENLLSGGTGTSDVPDSEAELSAIQIVLPRTNWHQHEKIKQWLSVLAIYSNGSAIALNSADYTLLNDDPTAVLGTVQLNVSYQKFSASMDINVLSEDKELPALVALDLTVKSKNWYVGETFLPVVTAMYTDSSYGIVLQGVNGYTLDPARPTEKAQDELEVKASFEFGGITKSDSVIINVKPTKAELPVLTRITTSVSKKTWKKLEPFNINIESNFSDGSSGVIEYGYVLTPASPTAVAEKDRIIEVSYKGFKSSVHIDVVEEDAPELESILASPAKPTWLLNEPFYMNVTANYTDGTSGTITKGCYTTPGKPTDTAGDVINVTATYKGQTSSFEIKVVSSPDKLEPLERITAVPDALSYSFKAPYQITVNAYYGSSEVAYPITTGFVIDPVDLTGVKTGTIPVTVSYTDNYVTKTASFEITVIPITIGSSTGGAEKIFDITEYVVKPESTVYPDTRCGQNQFFTVSSIEWKEGDNGQIDPYRANKVYTAIVSLTANTGFTFKGVNANKFKHDDADTVENAANTAVVTIVFPATGIAPPELASITVTVNGATIGPAGVLTPAFNSAIKYYTFSTYGKNTGSLSFTVNATLKPETRFENFTSPKTSESIAYGSSATIEIPVMGSVSASKYTVKLNNGTAGGGTVTLVKSGDSWREIHKFTSGGTLNVNNAVKNAHVLVVAGGGGGGGGPYAAGGGGAGGYLENSSYALSAKSYPVTVGGGGSAGQGFLDSNNSGVGDNGGNSVFDTMTAIGGGGGGKTWDDWWYGPQGTDGKSGGSGGGAGAGNNESHHPMWTDGRGGSGTSGQGNSGGGATDTSNNTGGGGGAGGPGVSKTAQNHKYWGGGGPGKASSVTGTSVTYAAGGPVSDDASSHSPGAAGAPNTGNGGMGGWNSFGGGGGSGIVVVSIPIE